MPAMARNLHCIINSSSTFSFAKMNSMNDKAIIVFTINFSQIILTKLKSKTTFAIMIAVIVNTNIAAPTHLKYVGNKNSFRFICKVYFTLNILYIFEITKKIHYSLFTIYYFYHMIKLIECPRDAMQGWAHFIPTEKKVNYLNTLLQVGFDTLDFGSFVSAKAIPQLADTKNVLPKLQLTNTKLLAIVANVRGAEEAAQYDEISFIGFPFSISETFQQRNTNSSIEQSLSSVEAIQKICLQKNKQLVIYISMGFGNPYGDEYSPEIAANWVAKMNAMGIKIVALSDTIGIGNPANISYLFKHLIPLYPQMEIGAHLHTTPDTWKEKIDAAYNAGCKRFDGVLKGFGGCPMATDKLTGNMPTENMIQFFGQENLKLNGEKLAEAMLMANEIFM